MVFPAVSRRSVLAGGRTLSCLRSNTPLSPDELGLPRQRRSLSRFLECCSWSDVVACRIYLRKALSFASLVTSPQHVYEVRQRKDKRGADLISDALTFGWLWHGGATAVSNAIGYAEHHSRSHNAVIRIYDDEGNVIETLDLLIDCFLQ